MPNFSYQAITTQGQVVTGTREAGTSGEVESWLINQGQHPIAITVAEDAETSSAEDNKSSLFKRMKRIKIDDRILFCRQVSTLLDAGVPILQALNIMANQITNTRLKRILFEVAERVEEGDSLSESFSNYQHFASPLFFSVVKVGEETGTLDKSFLYLAQLYENEKEIKERIKTATRYPKIVITAMFGAILFLMSFVVPKFIDLFSKAGVELPLPTRILISISSFTVEYIWLILFSIVGGFVAYRIAMKYESYRFVRDKIWLRVPIFGDLSLKIYLSRFTRVFAVLMKSGVDVIKTLELSATALENLVIFYQLEQVTADVREGKEMHDSMAQHKVFPDMVVQMMAIGEQSGQVDDMMDKVANYYDRETNYTIKNLSTLIEPILLLFMGVMVGFLALAIYMPMWNMMNVMKGG